MIGKPTEVKGVCFKTKSCLVLSLQGSYQGFVFTKASLARITQHKVGTLHGKSEAL